MADSPINYLLALGLQWASAGAGKVAGLARADADEVYQVVTKARALPRGYAPKDVVRATKQGISAYTLIDVRRIIVPDLRAMFQAARADGVQLNVISGYRSYAVQQMVFAKWTRQDGGAEQANRYSALPGHSQHQLGTAVDLNSFGETFAESKAGRWIWANAYRFGFVFPFTLESSPETGYAYEPWHVRWVGRELAAIMEGVGYRESGVFTADQFVAAVREVAQLPGATTTLRRSPTPPVGYLASRLSGPQVR